MYECRQVRRYLRKLYTHLENESNSNHDKTYETPNVLNHSLNISISKVHHIDNTNPKTLLIDENSSPSQPGPTDDNGRVQIETANAGSCSTKHVKDVKQSDLRQKEQKLRKREEELKIREKLNEEMQNERIWLQSYVNKLEQKLNELEKSNSILRKQNEVHQESMTKEPYCNCHKRTSNTDHIVTNLHEKVSNFILQQIDTQVDNMIGSLQSTTSKSCDKNFNNSHDQLSTKSKYDNRNQHSQREEQQNILNTKLLPTNNERANIDHSFTNQPVYTSNIEGKHPNPDSTFRIRSRKPTDPMRVEHRSNGILTQNTSAYGTDERIHHTANYGNQHVSNTYVGQPLFMSHIVNRDNETNDQNRNPSMYNYGHLNHVK